MAFAGLSVAVPADDGIGLDGGGWTPAPRAYTPAPSPPSAWARGKTWAVPEPRVADAIAREPNTEIAPTGSPGLLHAIRRRSSIAAVAPETAPRVIEEESAPTTV